MKPILLSPPHMTGLDRAALLDAFDSNWIAPCGPDVDGFEKDVAELTGVAQTAALSSGTAALHLALDIAGVAAGDHVIVPSLTFAATANAVTYLGARPRFVDSDPVSWNIDPELVEAELDECRRSGVPVTAVVAVDLYGRCADYTTLEAVCDRAEVPLIVDAAESLGARHRGRPAGTGGFAGVFSFNGNKILTTSGGGVLVSDDAVVIERARFLASQAREPEVHYEHHEVGFNYRMSNLLAALGRSQLAQLPDRLMARGRVEQRYREALADHSEVHTRTPAAPGETNHWLTVVTVDGDLTPGALVAHLAQAAIEARPAWKPLHRQPAYTGLPMRGGSIADKVFASGVCLPSGSNLTPEEQDRVIDHIRRADG